MDLNNIHKPDQRGDFTRAQVEKILQKMVIKKQVDKATGKNVYVAWAVLRSKSGTERTVKITIYNADPSENKEGGGLDEVVKTIKTFQNLSKKLNDKQFQALFSKGSEWRTIPAQGVANKVALQRFNPNKKQWQSIATERWGKEFFMRDPKQKHFMYTYDTSAPSEAKEEEPKNLPWHKRLLEKSKKILKGVVKKPIVMLGGVGAEYLFTTRSKQIENISHVFNELIKKPGYEAFAKEKIKEMETGVASKPSSIKPLEVAELRKLSSESTRSESDKIQILINDQTAKISTLNKAKGNKQIIESLIHVKDQLDYQNTILQHLFLAKSLQIPEIKKYVIEPYITTIEHMSLMAKKHFELIQDFKKIQNQIIENGETQDLKDQLKTVEDKLIRINELLSSFSEAIDKQKEMIEFIVNMKEENSNAVTRRLTDFIHLKTENIIQRPEDITTLTEVLMKWNTEAPVFTNMLKETRESNKDTWRSLEDIIAGKKPKPSPSTASSPPPCWFIDPGSATTN